jgi:tRNA nucleotidyltransferase/poly(A) polymerase
MTDARFIRSALDALPRDGVWLVGGVLRDVLLKRPVRDVDVAVAGDAAAIARRAGARLGVRAFALDAERGTYRLPLKGPGGEGTLDVSRLQGKNVDEDLARRDYAVNAMALPAAEWGRPRWRTALLDPFGGLRDLAARRLRLVSPQALREDPLRLLRGFRFSAELGFRLEPDTRRRIRREARRLSESAAERVREELFKIFATPRAAEALRGLEEAGLLEVVFPEVEIGRASCRERVS